MLEQRGQITASSASKRRLQFLQTYFTGTPLTSTNIVGAKINPEGSEIDIAIARASSEAAESLDAKVIVAMTESGHTAALMSGCRPNAPILAITPDERVRRKLSLYWGINSLLMQMHSNTDDMVAEAGRLLLANGFSVGNMVVMTMGAPVAARNNTNQIRVFRLGE